MKVLSLVLVFVAINTKQLLADESDKNFIKKLAINIMEPYLAGLPLSKILNDVGDNMDENLLKQFVNKFVSIPKPLSLKKKSKVICYF